MKFSVWMTHLSASPKLMVRLPAWLVLELCTHFIPFLLILSVWCRAATIYPGGIFLRLVMMRTLLESYNTENALWYSPFHSDTSSFSLLVSHVSGSNKANEFASSFVRMKGENELILHLFSLSFALGLPTRSRPKHHRFSSDAHSVYLTSTHGLPSRIHRVIPLCTIDLHTC